MARLARLVVPGLPHHITQRGNRRQQTFFCDQDYAAYVELMAEWCLEGGVEVWAYCLMPNHVPLIAMPQSEDGRPTAGDRLAGGHAVRGIESGAGWFAGRCRRLALEQRKVALVGPRRPIGPGGSDAGDGRRLAHLIEQHNPRRGEDLRDIREHGRTGCPLGSVTFVQRLEQSVGRVLRPRNPGRPHKLLKRP